MKNPRPSALRRRLFILEFSQCGGTSPSRTPVMVGNSSWNKKQKFYADKSALTGLERIGVIGLAVHKQMGRGLHRRGEFFMLTSCDIKTISPLLAILHLLTWQPKFCNTIVWNFNKITKYLCVDMSPEKAPCSFGPPPAVLGHQSSNQNLEWKIAIWGNQLHLPTRCE